MKKVISTDNAPRAIGPYSQAIEANGLVFISGQIAIDPVTNKFKQGTIEEEIKQVLENIGAILKEVGLSFNHIAKTTVYLVDLSLFPKMNEVYASYFTENPPARATVEVTRLPMGAKVEIEAIAVK